jgi:hypothetical protein
MEKGEHMENDEAKPNLAMEKKSGKYALIGGS